VLTVVRHDGPTAVTINPRGDVDPATAPALDEAFTAVLAGDATTPVVVDLSEVGFLDSAGIGALLRGRRRTVEAGRSFRVVAPDGFIAQVLQLAGVWELLSGGDS
jgi:anti-sigma B factor antagonist